MERKSDNGEKGVKGMGGKLKGAEGRVWIGQCVHHLRDYRCHHWGGVDHFFLPFKSRLMPFR